MKPIYNMWKMVDIVRETEPSRFTDTVTHVIKENEKLGNIVVSSEAERKGLSVEIKLGSLADEIPRGIAKEQIRKSYISRYYNGTDSIRVYSSCKDKIGEARIDSSKNGDAESEASNVRTLLEECIKAGFLEPNLKDENLVYPSDRGLSFTHPLWGVTHWRTRGRYYGLSLGLFKEWVNELGVTWKGILWLLTAVVTSIGFNYYKIFTIVQNNIQDFIFHK